jgi:hypothetical protein
MLGSLVGEDLLELLRRGVEALERLATAQEQQNREAYGVDERGKRLSGL